MKMKWYSGALFPLLIMIGIIFASPFKTNAEVLTGTIKGWAESGPLFVFDDHVSVHTDIVAWWSKAGLDGGPGYFYGYNNSTEIAEAEDVTDISKITDASTYTYTNWVTGPVYVGDIVLFHNVVTGYYAAFRVDMYYSPGVVDVTWYLQDNGTGDFSDGRVVSVPAGIFNLLLF